MIENVCVVKHPVAQHHLGRLRDASVAPAEFRLLVRRVTTILACASTDGLTTCEAFVETPVARARVQQLPQRIALVPVLRAGLGMLDTFLELLPEAEVRHLGVYRDEATAEPVEYYCKVPSDQPPDVAFVLDPMLATGGSAMLALDVLRRWGVRQTRLVSLIAAPEGLAAVRAHSPDTLITVAAIDERLNDRKFIVPGLGDAGDRLFHT